MSSILAPSYISLYAGHCRGRGGCGVKGVKKGRREEESRRRRGGEGEGTEEKNTEEVRKRGGGRIRRSREKE
jgi:hypothetical protein